jgi:GDP-4-dehydro-6-deoxy-D-mannose reductase
MHVLITGMAGFAGGHLADLLLAKTDWTLVGLSRNATKLAATDRVRWHEVDMTDAELVRTTIVSERPDAIIHLAAQANVPRSWENPWFTYEQNVRGQLHIFQGVLSAGIAPRVLIVSSNEVYGAPSPDELPIRESKPLRPNNPYAVSKAAQDLMALQYHISHRCDVVVARPFNHVGPGQRLQYVIPSLAMQVAQIEAGMREPTMALGNMAAQRDFTDVRDVVAAYLGLLRSGAAGEVYNVCSGAPRSIQSVLDTLTQLAGLRITQTTDPAKFRPVDTPVSYGDSTRLRAATGWTQSIPFEQTLLDMLNEARERCRNTQSAADKE